MKIIPTILAMLTWKFPLTFQRTLMDFKPTRFLFEEAMVVCQGSDPAELGIAEKFGYKTICYLKMAKSSNRLTHE